MAAQTPGRAASVVVADDEPHVLEYLATVLRIEGFDVAGTAGDSDGAVRLAERMRPDIALLDLHMPGGGLSAAQLIGSLSPETKIVIFSGAADEPEILPLLQMGIDGYVLKGSSPDRLAEALRSALVGDKYLAPAVSRVALAALTTRLNAEEQVALQRQREVSRVSSLITEHRFTSVFQPIIDLRTERAVAVEALTRFNAVPDRTPLQWFTEATQAGLGIPLELATASTALGHIAEVPEPLGMTVNVSPDTILSGRMSEVLLTAPLSRVVLEITEHAAVADYRALRGVLQPWRQGGLRVAVDDAGGGYASFAHILNLEPDFIKIDVDLTRDIQHDRHRQALVRAIAGFAAEMEVDVVAEGIETVDQMKVLAELGTAFGQGFHLGRPRPLAEQADLLRAAVDLRREDEADPAPADEAASREPEGHRTR